MTVVFYTRQGCHLCETALGTLRQIRRESPFELEVRDVDADAEWRALYGMLVPVTALPNGDELHYRVDPDRVRKSLKGMA